jgi:hypothetical protein
MLMLITLKIILLDLFISVCVQYENIFFHCICYYTYYTWGLGLGLGLHDKIYFPAIVWDRSYLFCLRYNPMYLGVRAIRALNVSRGSREGNNAFAKVRLHHEILLLGVKCWACTVLLLGTFICCWFCCCFFLIYMHDGRTRALLLPLGANKLTRFIDKMLSVMWWLCCIAVCVGWWIRRRQLRLLPQKGHWDGCETGNFGKSDHTVLHCHGRKRRRQERWHCKYLMTGQMTSVAR